MQKYLAYSLALAAALAGLWASLYTGNRIIGCAALVAYTILLASRLTKALTPALRGWPRYALGILMAGAGISALGGAVYLAWNLGSAGMGTALSLLGIGSVFLVPPTAEPVAKSHPIEIWWIAALPLAIVVGVCILLLLRVQTDAAVTSPWPVVSKLFWAGLAVASALGIALCLKTSARISSWVSLLLFGLAFSVAVIVYKIGYGFDPFIHQATEQYIIAHGAISPKTVYYAGQYALVTIISKISGASVHGVDIFLLPILGAAGITSAITALAYALKRPAGPMYAVAMALLPLSPFIVTTPFGLATLYALIAALLALPESNVRHRAGSWLFGAAALFTHPLAGVPVFFLLALIALQGRGVYRWIGRILVGIGGIAALPLLFMIFAKLSGNGSVFDASALQHPLAALSSIPIPWQMPLTRFHPLGDLVYALGIAAVAVIVAGAIASIKDEMLAGREFVAAAAITALSGIVLALTVSFPFLPDYEQGGYAARLLLLSVLFFFPPAIVAGSTLLRRATLSPFKAVSGIAVASLFFVGGIYLAYPRSDAYVLGHGYSTSKTDLLTVQSIAEDAGTTPYVALAAQPVSAAALNRYGFFRYFPTSEGLLYAYPVPTGGALYPYFLNMVYTDPTSEYMRQAMNLAKVKTGYFVVNTYWSHSEHVIARAKQTADSWFAINDSNYVFKYSMQ